MLKYVHGTIRSIHDKQIPITVFFLNNTPVSHCDIATLLNISSMYAGFASHNEEGLLEFYGKSITLNKNSDNIPTKDIENNAKENGFLIYIISFYNKNRDLFIHIPKGEDIDLSQLEYAGECSFHNFMKITTERYEKLMNL